VGRSFYIREGMLAGKRPFGLFLQEKKGPM